MADIDPVETDILFERNAPFDDETWIPLVIGAATLRSAIAMDEAITLIAAAMQRVSDGRIDAPERWFVPAGPGGGLALMPGSDPSAGCFGIKVLSLFTKEARGKLAGHQGVMLLFDYDTGRPLAVIDANALTGMRTAAASAAATDALARPEARSLALIGTGQQAAWHIRTIPLVRPISEVRLWARSAEAARQFASAHCRNIPNVLVFDTVEEAVGGADIVCTLTHASQPILDGRWLRQGQHLNLVGSSTAASREIDDLAVKRCHFVVDSKRNALSQAGELLSAIRAGLVTDSHIKGEIGDVLAGRTPGRPGHGAITAYKSLGHVAQDLALADKAFRHLTSAGGE